MNRSTAQCRQWLAHHLPEPALAAWRALPRAQLRARIRETDKQQHFFCSMGLALLLSSVATPAIGLPATFLLGLVKEIWDERYGSGFCWYDMAANAIGIMAALPLILV